MTRGASNPHDYRAIAFERYPNARAGREKGAAETKRKGERDGRKGENERGDGESTNRRGSRSRRVGCARSADTFKSASPPSTTAVFNGTLFPSGRYLLHLSNHTPRRHPPLRAARSVSLLLFTSTGRRGPRAHTYIRHHNPRDSRDEESTERNATALPDTSHGFDRRRRRHCQPLATPRPSRHLPAPSRDTFHSILFYFSCSNTESLAETFIN